MRNEALLAAFIHPEIIAGIQYAYYVVHGFIADRIKGMPVFKDSPRPVLIVVLHMQGDNFPAVRADFLNISIVKFKYVLNNLVFLRLDSALLVAFQQQAADFLLGNLFLLFFRIDFHKAKYTVSGYGKKPDKRRKDFGNAVKHSGHAQRQGFGLFHRNALRHQFSENKRKI